MSTGLTALRIVCQVCGYETPGNENADRAEIVAHVKAEHPFLFAALKAARAASEETGDPR